MKIEVVIFMVVIVIVSGIFFAIFGGPEAPPAVIENAVTNENVELRNLRYVWPRVFTDPDFEYRPTDVTLAVADGLIGWGLRHIVIEQPENFIEGMFKVAVITDTNGTPDELLELAREWD